MGKREKKIGSEIMDEWDRIFDMDDHSPAQTVVYKACTFIASLLYCVAERASLTWHWRAIQNKVQGCQ